MPKILLDLPSDLFEYVDTQSKRFYKSRSEMLRSMILWDMQFNLEEEGISNAVKRPRGGEKK